LFSTSEHIIFLIISEHPSVWVFPQAMTVDGSFYSVPSPIAHLLVAALLHVMVQCLLGAMGQSESLSELNFLGIEKWENI